MTVSKCHQWQGSTTIVPTPTSCLIYSNMSSLEVGLLILTYLPLSDNSYPYQATAMVGFPEALSTLIGVQLEIEDLVEWGMERGGIEVMDVNET